MTFLVSAKGNDITAWRAARDFAANYRQTMLECAASNKHGSAAELFEKTSSTLERLGNEHETLLLQLGEILNEVAVSTSTAALNSLTVDFYSKLYNHMDLFHSAPVFYQMSMAFLRQISSALVNHALNQLGLFAARMPPVSLVALGPAGRFEFSPFCPLQLMVVHGETDASGHETLNLFGNFLHTGFEALGLKIDPAITPRNPAWRKSLKDWKQFCVHGLEQNEQAGIIELLRLADQYLLPPHEETGQQFREFSNPFLKNARPALANLVSRMMALSNGLSMMGNLKLERSRSEADLFNLTDYGLMPLSSAITALSLIKGTISSTTPDKVLELLKRNELNVDLSETILSAWHTLHEFLLLREKSFSIDPNKRQAIYLNLDELNAKQIDTLKMALEKVNIIQRQVGIIFSWTGD